MIGTINQNDDIRTSDVTLSLGSNMCKIWLRGVHRKTKCKSPLWYANGYKYVKKKNSEKYSNYGI